MLRAIYVDNEDFEICKRCGEAVTKENSPHVVARCFEVLKDRLSMLEGWVETIQERVDFLSDIQSEMLP